MNEAPPNMDVNREFPGYGQRFPKRHFVRIVVVDAAHGGTAMHGSKGQGQGGHIHRLTDNELSALQQALGDAEEKLKKMPPPGASPAGAAPGSAGSSSMFDTLTPTDIVVVGQEAASVCMADSSGKPVSANATRQAGQPAPTRRLLPHDAGNRDTVLRVWTDSDTIEYQCDVEFAITKVERAGSRIHGAPENPFGGAPPYRAKESTEGGKLVWVLISNILPSTANNQQYKMTFEINGKEVDPDVVCGDPPPL